MVVRAVICLVAGLGCGRLEFGRVDRTDHADSANGADSSDSSDSNGTAALVRCTGVSFAPRQSYAVGVDPYGLHAADLDKDGFVDIMTADFLGPTVSVLRGNGDGTFGTKTSYAVGAGPYSVYAGDYDGDGWLDLASANNSADTVTLLHNNGDGTFAAGGTIPVGAKPARAIIARLDNDAMADLAVSNFNGASIWVFPGSGSGFTTHTSYVAGTSPQWFDLGDVNNDGRADLIVPNSQSSTLGIYLAQTDGTFAAEVSYPVGWGACSAAIADFDRDTLPDVAVADYFDNTMSVLRGTGGGAFGPRAPSTASGAEPSWATASDFDGDGAPDLVIANKGQNVVTLLQGRGDGTFAAPIELAAGAVVLGVIAVDLDRDGRIDLVSTATDDSAVNVLMNNCPPL